MQYVENAIAALRQERVDAELQYHEDKERFQFLQRAALRAARPGP